jgi:hypothetical protein
MEKNKIIIELAEDLGRYHPKRSSVTIELPENICNIIEKIDKILNDIMIERKVHLEK